MNQRVYLLKDRNDRGVPLLEEEEREEGVGVGGETATGRVANVTHLEEREKKKKKLLFYYFNDLGPKSYVKEKGGGEIPRWVCGVTLANTFIT